MRRFWAVWAVVAALCLFSAGARPLTTRSLFLGSDPVSLDPASAVSEPERTLVSALYEGLVELDPRTGAAQPGLARRWSVDSDGLTLSFELRPSVWSDGTAVTARTFVDSWLRVLDPQSSSPGASLLTRWIAGAAAFHDGSGPASGVKLAAPDDQTLRVTFVRPLTSLSELAQPAFLPVPPHQGGDSSWAGTVVNGPFQVEQRVAQDRVTLVPNDRYWDASAVGPLRLIFLVNADADWGADLFRRGDVDADLAVPAGTPRARVPAADQRDQKLLATRYLLVNRAAPGLSDVKVRRALALAIQRDDLVQQGGPARPAYSFCPPFPSYQPPVFAGRDDRTLALRLLDQAGRPDQTLVILTPAAPTALALARAVRDDWAQVGVDADVRVAAPARFADDVAHGRYSVALEGWQADGLDPGEFLSLLTGTFAAADPEGDYDAVMARADHAVGAARRRALTQAETILMRGLPVIPLVFPSRTVWVKASRWSGWAENPLGTVPWKRLRAR